MPKNRRPPHPPSRGLPAAGRPATGAIPKKTRREEAKTLSWKQKKAAGLQHQAETPAAESAVVGLDPRWMEAAFAAAAADQPNLPPMVPLPPFPASKAALSRPRPVQSSVQTVVETPLQNWGGPATSTNRPVDWALIGLSPPPACRALSHARFHGARPDARQMQNVRVARVLDAGIKAN